MKLLDESVVVWPCLALKFEFVLWVVVVIRWKAFSVGLPHLEQLHITFHRVKRLRKRVLPIFPTSDIDLFLFMPVRNKRPIAFSLVGQSASQIEVQLRVVAFRQALQIKDV